MSYKTKILSFFVKKPILRIILLFVFVTSLQFKTTGQAKLFEARNLDLSDFPTVKGELWSRDPNGLNTDDVLFSEYGKQSAPKFSGNKFIPKINAQNKCIIFLVLNPGTADRGGELAWYKQVIKDVLDTGNFKPGDKIAILDFNHENGGQLLYPNKLVLTQSLGEAMRMLDNIKIRSARSLCMPSSQKRSLILPAINQTLELVENEKIDMPTGIFVMSDDRACITNNLIETPGARSQRLNVPVYGITFEDNSINSIKTDLVEKSFGQYHDEPFPFTNYQNSVAKLKMFLKSFLTRYSGITYSFEYTSTLEKNARNHDVEILYNGQKSAFVLTTPRKSIIEWIQANYLLSAFIFIFLIIAGFATRYFVNKHQEKIRLQELLKQQEMQELESRQKDQARKITEQNEELERIKRHEQEQRLREQQKLKEIEDKKRSAELTEQMRLRGNFPWFDYDINGQSFRYEVRKPELIAGRSDECDLQLNSNVVSRRHFRLIFQNNAYFIEDLQSVNGVYVNGRKVDRCMLNHGDVIQIADLKLNFRI